MNLTILRSLRLIAGLSTLAFLASAQSFVNNLSSAPSSLTFVYRIGSSTPASQGITISSSLAPVLVTSSATVNSPIGAAWLSVSPATGTTPANFVVSVNPAGLTASTYTGQVIMTGFATNSPHSVPVTLTVLPALTIAPTSLTFSYRLNETLPVSQSFTVSSGGSPITVSAFVSPSLPAPWLSVAPTGGSTPATFTASVNTSGLTAGTYNGVIQVNALDAANGFTNVPVTLNVLPPLAVAPTSLTFAYRINGPTPASQAFTASSGGSPVLVNASASTIPSGGTWLSVAPSSGNTPAAFNVSVAPSGLTAGTYNGTVRVTATDTANGFIDVPVTLNVLPALTVAPTTLTFAYRVNGAAPGSQTFAVSSGGSPVAVNAVAGTTPAGGTWLSVAPSGGTTPATFTVSVSPGSLAAGTYNGNVRVTATDTANGFIDVPVTLTVSALSAAPSSLTFTYRINGTAPAPQAFTASIGGSLISVNADANTIPAGGTWLSVAPSSGTTPATFNVSVTPSGLTAGTYNGTVRVIESEGSDAFVDVPVTLNVLPALTVAPTTLTFAYRVNGAAPGSQTFAVSSGGSPVAVNAVASTTPAGGTWLSVAPSGGTTPATFTVSVSPGSVAAGTYNGNVRVTATDTANGFIDVPVTLTVSALSAAPSSLTFTYRINGATPGSQAFTASIGGPATPVDASASTTPSGGTWLSVAPSSGNTPAAFNVSVAPSGLTAGTYNGTVRVTATDTANGFIDVPVTLNVLPALTVAPTTLTFAYRVNGAAPGSQTFAVSSGGSPVAVNAVASTTPAGGSWLSVAPSGGTTPATFTVSVSPGSLAAGTYNGNVRVTATDTANGFIDVPITLTVSALSAAPSSLTFTYRINGTAPAPQAFTASVVGSPVLVNAAPSTTPAGGTWLSVAPSSGTTPAAFNVSVSPGSLAAGTYTGTVRVIESEGSDAFVDVPVTLNVLPALTVAPTTLTFAYRVNGAAPGSQTFAVSSGGSPVAVNAVASTTPAGGTWLSVAPSGGTTPATFTVSVSPGSLAAGTYNGNVRVTATDTANGFIDVPVTLTVSTFSVAPSSLTFTYRINGTTPGSQPFTASIGGSPISVNAAASTTPSGGTWLSVAPSSGTTPATFNVSVSPGSLAAGTYTGSVRVIESEGSDAFIDVPVTLNVLPPLAVAPTALTFTYRVNGPAPTAQTFTASSGASPVLVNAAASTTPAGGTWLSVTPSSGNTPATFSVSVSPGALIPETYNGTIRVTATGTPGGFIDVPVTLTVLPALSAAPTSLTFTYRINGTVPGTQTFTASTGELPTGITAVASTVPSGGTWLTVTPGTGTTPGTLTVAVNPGGLAAGTYNGNIRVTATDAANSFVEVPVTLIVNAALSANPAALTFSHRFGGTAPGSQTFVVTNGPGAVNVSAAASVLTPAGATWLAVSPPSGATPATFTVSVTPGTLEPGTYNGRIAITPSNPADAPFEVPVTLTVTPRVSANPTSLTFTHRVDLNEPETQTVVVSTGANAAPVNAVASTVTGGSWLAVVPAAGTTPATFTVSVTPFGLAPGTYTGSVSITASDTFQGQVQVPVTLNVLAAMDPAPTPGSLSFLSINRTVQSAQPVTISRPDSEELAIAAQTLTPEELSWVQISLTPPGSNGTWTTSLNVPSGPSNAVVYVRADPARIATLPFGNYSGRVRIRSGEESEQTTDVPVSLQIRSQIITVTGRCPSVTPGAGVFMPISVNGGSGTYTLTFSGPAGLALSANTGPAGATPFVTGVQGTVQAVGDLPLTITATDHSGSTAGVLACNIVSTAREPFTPPITFSPGPNCPAGDFTVGTAVNGRLSASGGTGSFDFRSEGLPPGMLLLGDTLTGAPNTAGTYSYTIQASSGSANPVQIRCTARVQPAPLQIRTGCPTPARQGDSYSFPIIPSGGLGGSSYELSISGLPVGLVATRGGIGGVPAGDPGSYDLTISVRSGEQVVTQSCPITITDPLNRPPAPTGSISCPESVLSGSPVAIAVAASGGTGALSFSISGPEWLQVQPSASGAAVSGMAGTPGTYPFTITVADSGGGTTRLQCSLVVTPRPLVLTGAECPGPITLGEAFDIPLSITGGTGPFRWELSTNAPGVSLGASVGTATQIGGTPLEPGDFPFTVAVTDAAGVRRERACTLRVAPAPLTITSDGCPTAPLTRPATVSAPLTAAGGFGEYSWRLTGEPWLSLSASTGQATAVSGTPPAPGDYQFTATLTDASGTPQTAFTCRFTVAAITPPPVQISGLAASIGASESGDLQLQLASPAPVPLTATVTLEFIPDVALPGVTDNPLVQFTGGRQRTLTIQIPAGQQTVPLGARVVVGNIAGTIRVVLSSLLDGTQQLAGANPPTAELRVPRQAPVIDGVTFDRTGVVIRGFSNTLDVQSVTLAFQPGPDGEVEGPSTFTFSNEVQEFFRQFYQNRNPAAGSAFQVRFPITLEGNNNGIASVIVTMRNSAGETTTQAIPLR